MWNPLVLIKAGIDLVKEPIKGWNDRKKIKVEAQMEVLKNEALAKVESSKALIEAAKHGAITEADWDARAQADARNSWKDEVLMLILFFPVTVMFIAALFGNDAIINRMITVVESLEKFPYWYQVILWGIVAAVYGLRWLIAPLISRFKKNNSCENTAIANGVDKK